MTTTLDIEAQRIAPPFPAQTFTSFQEWVNKAASWLTRHPEYNNTQHGDSKGWRGHHFTALCFDSFGRRCRNGGDFQRAHDEGAFPVWWIWPDQIVEALTSASSAQAREAALIAQRDALLEATRNLSRCLLPIHMGLAEREMIGEPVPPAAVVLSFMGSGASDSVTAHEVTDALDQARAAITLATGGGE